MLATKYEWQLSAFEDPDHAPMGSWEAVLVSFDTTPFLMHNTGMTSTGEPFSVLIPSIDVLIEELMRLPAQTLEQVAIEILSPTNGSQPVSELWTYQSGDDSRLHYAYVSRDGALAPCNPDQPRAMTGLKRKFLLTERDASAYGPAARTLLEAAASP